MKFAKYRCLIIFSANESLIYWDYKIKKKNRMLVYYRAEVKRNTSRIL